MNRTRRWLAVAGTAVFLLALVVVVSPGTAGLLAFDAVVDAIGGPYAFVAAFGVIAFVVLVSVMIARAVEGLDESTPPDPEDVYRVPQPGHRFDAFVEGRGSLTRRLFGSDRETARARLQQTALATLMRVEGLSREEAKRTIERGTWTDDRVAAAFLSGRRQPSLGERLLAAARGESPVQHGARRAADALARYDEGSP